MCLPPSRRVEPKKSQTTAKILEALVKIDQRIDAQKIAAVDKEEGKEISLTTSKINYMGEPEPGLIMQAVASAVWWLMHTCPADDGCQIHESLYVDLSIRARFDTLSEIS